MSTMLKLTRLDRKICDALLEAKSNREIGVKLGIAERTVKAHLRTIFFRNGINDDRKHWRILLALRHYEERQSA